MYPRTNYEMTEADHVTLIEACKATPVMFLSGGQPMSDSPQQNANRAWAELGKRMGFDSETVQPISGKGTRFFSAVPSETEDQRTARLARELEEKRQARISQLQDEVSSRLRELADLGEAS